MKKSVALFGTLIAFLALSCGGDTTIHLHEENNTAEIKAAVEKVFSPDLAITELVLSTPKLDTRLDQIAVVFWEGDKEYTQTYNQKNGLQEKSENNLMLQIEHIKKEADQRKANAFKIKDIDYSKKYDNFIKAVKLVMEEYPENSEETYDNFLLHSYRFKATGPNEIRESLTVQAKKVGEAVQHHARSTTTNYYEFTFVVLDNGELEWR
ncbi:hypothetical protein HX062_13520 [Myroides sp. DF42-4-2]|nr:hypothetical protein [Myroides sp. NP-2]MDM1408654.1 hypothetical protein [Myroides sp. DF42-4-2]